MTPERLADWEALCAWLEERPYNASYRPSCRGAYLLQDFYPARRTVEIVDTTAEPRTFLGRVFYPKKTIPNPDYPAERERARWCAEIVRERRSIGLVYWAVGYGWRLRKDYREKLAELRAALGAQNDTPELTP